MCRPDNSPTCFEAGIFARLSGIDHVFFAPVLVACYLSLKNETRKAQQTATGMQIRDIVTKVLRTTPQMIGIGRVIEMRVLGISPSTKDSRISY